MKKVIKGILISVIALIIVYIILVLTKVLPNPFLDTKDLVCIRDSSNISLDDKVMDERVFKFDSWAKLKFYDEKTIYTFADEETAQAEYKNVKERETSSIVLDKNVLTVLRTYIVEKDSGYYGMSKDDIIKIYKDEFGYECK